MKTFLIGFLCSLVSSWHFSQPYSPLPTASPTQQVQYFDQILDHYDYVQPHFWKQRYFVNSANFHPDGPVILYICGQGICNGVPDSSWTSSLSQSTHSLILALEHRYYGDSLPFRADSFETENLKYLNSEQALRDIAYFIEEVKRNGWYGVTPSNKWVTIGGSYPGALSAWFRAKYPHLTVGALASSAVIEAEEDFRQFDQQIYLSALKSGSFCAEAIKEVTAYAEEKSLGEERVQFQGRFGAQNLTTREFMFYWSDVLVFQIQYGNRSAFCFSLKNKTLQQKLEQVIFPLMLKVSPVDYGAYYLSDPDFALQDGRGGRSWYYQCCTQLGYFQTYSTKHPMRSAMLTVDFYRKWCQDIYGIGTWPTISRSNSEFGGLHLRATNLIISNGDEDPWKWASLQQSYKSTISKVADCNDCGHCKDLHVPAKNDPKEITQIRDLQLKMIKEWIK